LGNTESYNMEQLTIGMVVEFIVLLGGGIGAWTKLNSEVTVLKSRIISLEKNEASTSNKLDALMEAIQEIKILLAKKGL
jgi:prefoldin subunit 5